MSRDLGKIKVGQEIYVKVQEMSNAARHLGDNIEEWIFKGEVLKVGRRYITVKFKNENQQFYHTEKFDIEDDYRQKYTCGGADYKLYLTKQDIIDEKKEEELYDKIKSNFAEYKNNHKFTLNQLQKIINIIDL